MAATDKTWKEFLEFLYTLPETLPPGRQRIRTVRDRLENLIRSEVIPNMNEEELATLFPLGFSPEESDLKLAAGVGLERGHISVADYERAIRADKDSGPFLFLQTRSGKTPGETVAPKIAEFWMSLPGDKFDKQASTEYFDFVWIPGDANGSVRIEMKASSEAKSNFQQIRDPRLSQQGSGYDYDSLLCLGLSNSGLEWWVFSAAKVVDLIESGVLKNQPGGAKAGSGTYWLRMNAENRDSLRAHQSKSESLRANIITHVT